jgi:hypothetical protein
MGSDGTSIESLRFVSARLLSVALGQGGRQLLGSQGVHPGQMRGMLAASGRHRGVALDPPVGQPGLVAPDPRGAQRGKSGAGEQQPDLPDRRDHA